MERRFGDFLGTGLGSRIPRFAVSLLHRIMVSLACVVFLASGGRYIDWHVLVPVVHLVYLFDGLFLAETYFCASEI